MLDGAGPQALGRPGVGLQQIQCQLELVAQRHVADRPRQVGTLATSRCMCAEAPPGLGSAIIVRLRCVVVRSRARARALRRIRQQRVVRATDRVHCRTTILKSGTIALNGTTPDSPGGVVAPCMALTGQVIEPSAPEVAVRRMAAAAGQMPA